MNNDVQTECVSEQVKLQKEMPKKRQQCEGNVCLNYTYTQTYLLYACVVYIFFFPLLPSGVGSESLKAAHLALEEQPLKTVCRLYDSHTYFAKSP